jgi:hypothetical protein
MGPSFGEHGPESVSGGNEMSSVDHKIVDPVIDNKAHAE